MTGAFVGALIGLAYWTAQPTLHKSTVLFSLDIPAGESNLWSDGSSQSETSSLIELAGLQFSWQEKNSVAQNIFERITSKRFLEKIVKEAKLDQDPFFVSEPVFNQNDEDETTLQTNLEEIQANLAKNISVELRPSGLFTISVSHVIKERAWKVSLSLVQELMDQVSDNSRSIIRDSLNFRVEELQRSRANLADAKYTTGRYFIENPPEPAKRLIETTRKLESLRSELETNEIVSSSLDRLERLGQTSSGNPKASYQNAQETEEELLLLSLYDEGLASVGRSATFVQDLPEIRRNLEKEKQKLLLRIDLLKQEADMFVSVSARKDALERELVVQEDLYNIRLRHFERLSSNADRYFAAGEWIDTTYEGHNRTVSSVLANLGVPASMGFLFVFALRWLWLLFGGKRVESELQLSKITEAQSLVRSDSFISIKERSWLAHCRRILLMANRMSTRWMAALVTETMNDPSGSVYCVSNLKGEKQARKLANALALMSSGECKKSILISVMQKGQTADKNDDKSQEFPTIIEGTVCDHCELNMSPNPASSPSQLEEARMSIAQFSSKYERVVILLPGLPNWLPLSKFFSDGATKLFIIAAVARAKHDDTVLVCDQFAQSEAHICWVAG